MPQTSTPLSYCYFDTKHKNRKNVIMNFKQKCDDGVLYE